ncbi:MAG: hypothetical protein NWE86_00085, partial [Candidatus Bathyarchaeota archaeon]|nr:hypothetical protein [Candidatus Bathyarchaeota archaeon]
GIAERRLLKNTQKTQYLFLRSFVPTSHAAQFNMLTIFTFITLSNYVEWVPDEFLFFLFIFIIKK